MVSENISPVLEFTNSGWMILQSYETISLFFFKFLNLYFIPKILSLFGFIIVVHLLIIKSSVLIKYPVGLLESCSLKLPLFDFLKTPYSNKIIFQ